MGLFYIACQSCGVNFHWHSSQPQICNKCKLKSKTFHKVQGEMNDIYKKHHNDKPEKEMSRSFLESIGFEKQDKSQRYVGYLGDYYVFEKCVWKRGYGTGINPLHLMHASKTDHLYMFTQIKYHDESEDTDMTCFSGTIDNETDFKRLLKQIGVEL